MSDNTETLLAFYLEDIQYARHHEQLRSQATNIILAAGAVLGATIGFDDSISSADIPTAIFLILIGVFGAAFNFKHYERYNLHYARAREYRSELANTTGLKVVVMKEVADEKHRLNFPRSHKWRLVTFWCGMPLCVSMMGIVVVALVWLDELVGDSGCTYVMKF